MSRLPRMIPVLGAVAIAAVTALTGCSSGQVTQTARQVSTINGASADLGDLALRDIRILYPSGGTYAAGSTAELVLVVVNRALETDTLVEVTGDFFDSAALPSSGSSASATPSATLSATPTDAPTQASLDTPVPAQGSLQFGTSDYPSIELTDLSEDISVGQTVSVTFVFEKAGEVTVDVPVANPEREIQREPGYDFHTEESQAG